MNEMEQCKFLIFTMEHQDDWTTILRFTYRRKAEQVTLGYQISLGQRLPICVFNPVTERSQQFEFECVGFRFEDDERMYKYPIRYRDSNARAGSKWPEADGVVLRDDLETQRAIEAVFVPWDWKERGDHHE